MILFLSNIILTSKFVFGFNFGFYSPSIYEFNEWLKIQNKGIIQGNFTLGGHLGIKLFGSFMGDVSADYFNSRTSYSKDNKLTLIPIDISLNYSYMFLPFLLYAYGGAGYSLCQIKYQEQKDSTLTLIDDIGWAIPLKLGIKFTATRTFSAEISYGYRCVIAPVKSDTSDIYVKVKKDGNFIKEPVPINIEGQYIRLSINREFF